MDDFSGGMIVGAVILLIMMSIMSALIPTSNRFKIDEEKTIVHWRANDANYKSTRLSDTSWLIIKNVDK